jgi:orotidine-5'-phosphate decarboxylase
MMNRAKLINEIREKKSILCVGLDTDINKIPNFLKKEYENPVLEFNKRIIEATTEYAVAYKVNTAFYEAQGASGWRNLEETFKMIPDNCFKIADAKRADVGNTSAMYAKAIYDNLGADAVTISPYMGFDSVEPFLLYPEKWAILLALTSNKGSLDFQNLIIENKKVPLYIEVIEKSSSWGTEGNIMYVIGATHPEEFVQIRKYIPHHFLLVPGVGSQGGNLEEIMKNGMNKDLGLLINVSRDIIYNSNQEDFSVQAGERAKDYREIMRVFIEKSRHL